MGDVVSVDFGNDSSRGVVLEKKVEKSLVPYIRGSLTVWRDCETKHFHSSFPSIKGYGLLESQKNAFEINHGIVITREMYDQAVKFIVDDLTYYDLYYQKQKVQPSLRKAFMKQRVDVARKKCMRILEQKFI